MGVAVIAGALIVRYVVWYELLLGFFVAFLLTAASMALNDYCDFEIDIVNEPDRPIPSGSILPLNALLTSILLYSLGLILSLFLGFIEFLVALLFASLAIIYNLRRERLSICGNCMVAACTAIPFIYGGIIAGRVEYLLLVFASIAFLVNVGREIVKGVVDFEGDRSMDIKTLATIHGPNYASRIAAMFYIMAIFLSFLPPFLELVSIFYLLLIAITDIGLILTVIPSLWNCSRNSARRAKNRSLLWMFIGLLAFIGGGA
jgi:geranylgeranylglycerol-phosphate geranylgeranyltransferase